MKTSETITKIAPAFLKAQKETGAAVKDASNPFFHSSYADLGSVMEACKDALNKNGISVLQPVGDGTLETILMHESGEWMSETMTLPQTKKQVLPDKTKGQTFEPYFTDDSQILGSTISYARRYALQSMVFIPAEDDDGNKASGKTVEAQQQAPRKTYATKPVTGTMAIDAAKPVDKGAVVLTPEDIDNAERQKKLQQLWAVWHGKGVNIEDTKAEVMKKYKIMNMMSLTVEELITEIKLAESQNSVGTLCSECKLPISQTVAQYALKKHGKALCMVCQRKL